MGLLMIRILNNMQDALSCIRQQEILENIPRAGTDIWMQQPIIHPGGQQWAVVLSDRAPTMSGDIVRLPVDWFPLSEL